MAATPSPGEGEPPRLTVAVDDLGTGLWGGKTKQEVEARLPLRNVLFSLSRAVVSVEELPVRYLDARGDAKLQRLRQLSHSPVAWFRSPLVLIVLASCGEYEDYKRDLRLRLKAMADTESSAPAQPELLFVYMRPPGADAAAKGPARVFDSMRRDLNRAKRERCVRLDPLPAASSLGGGAAALEPAAPALLGLDEFDRQLKDALRAAFEARAAAYAEEVRRLMLSRLDPSWSFSTLFLVKDGLAAMLESAGLLDDALREYSELEAVYLEALQSGQQARQAFGGKAPGEDEAALLWASWAATRQAASQPELPPEWVMRQALFASQARLLVKLHRHAEVAERGLAFVRSFGGLLARHQSAGSVPQQLREAWSFAGYLSLAETTSKLQAARAEEKRKADTLGRGGGRRARLSEAAQAAPQSPGSPTSPDSLPIPIPLSPSSLGITSLQVKIASSSAEGEETSSPAHWQRDSMQHPQLEWHLGALPSWAAAAATAGGEGASGGPGRESPGGGTAGSANLYCLLGQLYCGARAELLRLGAAAGLDLPKSAAAAGMAEPQQLAHAVPVPAAPAEAAGAASPAEPAPQSGTPQAATAVGAEEAEGALTDAPSATDLAQVDLGAPAGSGSSELQQQQQQQLIPPEQQGGSAQISPSPSDDQAAAAAALRLTAAPDGQADADSEALSGGGQAGGTAGSAGVSPRQVAPAPLEQLSMRSRAGALDADSQSSSPHSTSTQQSALQHALSDVQSADAGHAVAPPAAAAAQPYLQTEQNDMRSAERQVASALSDRSSRGGAAAAKAAAGAAGAGAGAVPPAAAAAAAAGAALPPWLVHWRLRAALCSQQLFTELFIELSEAAAKCYSQCGFLRNAALLRADVADALAKGGSMRRAAGLYERQCRAFLKEGWHALAAQTLPKLAACQLVTGDPGLAHTAAALLSLPAPFRGTPAERQAACQLLLQAAQLPGSQGGLGGSLPLLPVTPSAAAEGSINLSAVLAVGPAKTGISRFFGRAGPDGAPLLVPPPREARSAGGGATRAAVGDALAVQLVVHSHLLTPLPLREVVLTLAVLQEMTVIHSPRASPRAPGSALQRRSSLAAAPSVDPGFAASLEAVESLGGRERFEPQWQQVDELACSLVAISSSGGSSSSGSGGNGGLQRGNADSAILQPRNGEAVLPPGTSVLTFLAAPVQRGLYKALHLRARLQQLPLHVTIQPPDSLWQQQEQADGGGAPRPAAAAAPSAAAAASRRGSRAGAPLTPLAGGLPLTPPAPRPADAPVGEQAAEAILLQVEQAQPRVQLSLLAAGGSLIAGQEQWLGLALAPERDALQSARLELTWPLAHAAGGLAGLPPLSRKATGLGGHHRAVQSLGGDVHMSPAGSTAVALSTPPPFVRPEHRSAVLLSPLAPGGAQGDQQQSGQQHVQVVAVEGPSGPAASWMLSEGLVQQLSLPRMEEGQAVGLWWRVTAGEVPAPPEQVHIAPPAPRHSSRPHDARRLAGGLAGEAPATPAATLDLPASLEYASGCQRSHCRMLAVPVRQPFSIASMARELPSGQVALQCTLTSNLAVPAQLARLALEPQPGFSVASSLLDAMALLPATLAPGGSITAAFLLAPESGRDLATGGEQPLLPAKLQPSMLAVHYSVDSRQQCGAAAAPLGQQEAHQQQQQQQQHTPGAHAMELLGGSSAFTQRLATAAMGGDSPTAIARESGGGGGGESEGEGEGGGGQSAGSSRQLCSFCHLLTLESPASEEATTGTLVFVRLLGPFSATAGQPTTLCWRLERGGQQDLQQSATRITFEVQAKSDHWRPLGRRLGGVTLAGHAGAVATVEATWVPLAAGTLPVPALALQDVSFQEVFDVGVSGGSAITVAEAAAA